MNQIAERFKEVRAEKGYTIEYVAEQTGISAENLQAFEEGNKLPDATDLMQLSKTYEMSIDRILYKNNEIPKYDESKAVYANVKPVETAEDKDENDREHKINGQGRTHNVKKGAGILTHLVFPMLCIVIYIFLGVIGGFWHPGWVIFLGIPLYYILILITSKIGKNVDDAVQEYMDEENKKA